MIEIGGLIGLLINIIIICIVAAIVLWAVRYFMPQFYEPAKLIVGGLALIAILIIVAGLFGGTGFAVAD